MKASEIKKSTIVEYEGVICAVRDIERSAPTARSGNATFRFTLYTIPGHRKLDVTLRADDTLREVELARRPANFSYKDGEIFVFMDSENYTQYMLPPELVGNESVYIVEDMEGYYVQLIDEAPVGLQVPTSVKLTVTETTPELKGASATKRTKPAKLNTGIEIQVPEYIAIGEKVWVHTTTNTFAGRA
jgi:elongation factor P